MILLHGASSVRSSGEWFPNVLERDSGLFFATFFQRDRSAVDKGIVALDLSSWRQS
jgi:hypothetical protein